MPGGRGDGLKVGWMVIRGCVGDESLYEVRLGYVWGSLECM